MANLSLLGLYAIDPGLFSSMSYPEALDFDTLTDNIMMECAELEVIYPDPGFMAAAIAKWSRKEVEIWNHLYETQHYDYNPIWNKDGTITETEKETRDLAHGETSGRDISTTNTENTSGTTTHAVNAFNAGAYTDQSRDTSSASVTGQTRTDDDLRVDGTDTGTVTREYARVEKGNIALTTTQQMIREEREIAEFNLYDYIVQSFKRRFCLLIY